jgi:hypothetical protein
MWLAKGAHHPRGAVSSETLLNYSQARETNPVRTEGVQH